MRRPHLSPSERYKEGGVNRKIPGSLCRVPENPEGIMFQPEVKAK